MEHTKAYQEFKKNGNTKFVRYSEGAEMYHMGVSKFMQMAKDAKAIYKLGQLVLVNLKIFDEYLETWSLPVADLLYVGKSTNRKLALFGIKTIGDLARADEDVLNSHLGKIGSILWSFANGYDDSPVKLENTHAPIKSVGNSTTTPKDLVCDEDVKWEVAWSV